MRYSPTNPALYAVPHPGDDDAVDLAQLLRRHVQPAQPRAGVVHAQPSAQRVAHRVRLLEDFLEHVMRVIAELHVVAREIHLRHLVTAADGAFQRADFKAVALQHGHVVILQVNGFLRVRDDGLRIAAKEILAFAQADRQRAAAPRADDHAGHVEVDQRDAVRPDDLLERRAGGFEQARLVVRAARLVVESCRSDAREFPCPSAIGTCARPRQTRRAIPDNFR